MTGLAPLATVMPPPWPSGALPDAILKPRIIVAETTFWIITGVRPGPPAITVLSGPPVLRSTTFLPLIVMFSRYVPGETSTVSPL